MSGPGFRGRGLAPRGRKVRGLPSGMIGVHNPQQNFNMPRREGPGVPPPEYWLDHPPAVPWQQMNGLPGPGGPLQFGFDSHRYRGRPQFCPGIGARGRSKRIRGEGRPRLGIPQNPGFPGLGLPRAEPEPARFAPLGSEEERQQKIAETADKLKQKLSSLTVGEPVNFWEDDVSGVSFSRDEEHLIATKGIPELRHDPPELNLTVNDFKDIGRVDPDCGLNSGDCGELPAHGDETDGVQGDEGDDEDTGNWHEAEHRNHVNDGVDIIASNASRDEEIFRNDENSIEFMPGEKAASNSKKNGSQSAEVDQNVSERLSISSMEPRLLPGKLTEEQMSSVIGRAAAKALEKRTNTDTKPELKKSLEKLREVIKVDRELEKEVKAAAHQDPRAIYQPNAGPRLQPDVRLDFHPGIGPPYPRFQGFSHPGGPHEIGSRYRGAQFRPDPPIDCPPSFGGDYQRRFDHRPELQPRGLNLPPRNLPPRIMPPEFGPRNQDLRMGFDPREPPPRFNVNQRQELGGNPHWFGRNELPQKFAPQNGLQPPPGFDPRAPPPRFINQDQDLPPFGPNIIPGEFPQVVPMGYPQVPHIHMGPGYFNPALPPPNTAPCIMHKFQPPAPIPAVESQLPPPPLPIPALDVQSQILRAPPSPPSLPSQNPTPNMNEELEDMQEAMEFAKKLMNMTEEEEDATQTFDMPIFPDLPPIPSTEPSHLVEETEEASSLAQAGPPKETDTEIVGEKQGVEFGPQNFEDESTKRTEVNFRRKESTQEEELLEELARPKVAFNLNSRSKVIEWRHQSEAGSSRDKTTKEKTQKVQAEDRTKENAMREGKSNRKIKPQVEEKLIEDAREQPQTCEESLLKPREIRIENNILPVDIQVPIQVPSKSQEESKSRGSSSKSVGKPTSAAVLDANWKDKVINQFLKMSKNDICNMVNSSGLRKFDIAMKHLVKERKYSLSQERRCSADDAVKGASSSCPPSSSSYEMSREEFMSQLSAMLDPSAIVDVKNLPSKFIQHLSEVLKLDVESHLNDAADPIEENNGFAYDDGQLFADNERQSFTPEPRNSAGDSEDVVNLLPDYCAGEDFSGDVEAEIDVAQNTQMAPESADDGAITKTPPSMAVIDDIFSEEIAKAKQGAKMVTVPEIEPRLEKSRDIDGEFISHGLIRARCTRTLMSAENVDLEEIFSAESGQQGAAASPEELWTRNKRENPDMFRNLTKEEWEARCGRAAEPLVSKGPSLIRNLSPPRSPFREVSVAVLSTTEAADSWSKAVDEESESEGSSSSCDSGVAERPETPKVAKLLKVVKQREKIAKDKGLGETVRDEALEVERTRESEIERKHRKREKSKRRKERREKRKARKKKQAGLEVEEKSRNPSVVKQEAFIKQEELIIEADNELSVETRETTVTIDHEKENPQVADNSGKETTETSLQERDEALEEAFNAQETRPTPPTPQELREESSPVANVSVEHPEIESCESAEDSLGRFESKGADSPMHDTEIQLSKSGAKKIDIQAYKARKLKRNTEKLETSKEVDDSVETASVPALDKASAKETHKEKKGRDSESTSKKTPVQDAKEASVSLPQKDKNSGAKAKPDKREERHASKEKSTKSDKKNEKVISDDKIEKKRTRSRDRDSERSTSREEGRRNSKERSKHSHERRHKSRSNSRDSSAQRNNVVETRGRKSSRHSAPDSPKETVELKTQKRHSRRQKNINEDKDSKRETEPRVQSPGDVVGKIVIDGEKEPKDHTPEAQDIDSSKGTTHPERGLEETSNLIETDTVLAENREPETTELNTTDQTGEPNSEEARLQDHTDLPSPQDQNLALDPSEEPTKELAAEILNPDDKIEAEKPEKDVVKESIAKEVDHQCVQNDQTKVSAAANEAEVLKSDDSKSSENEPITESHEVEAAAEPDVVEAPEKSPSHEGEESVEEARENSCQNDIKSLLNDLIEKAITQLDLLSGKTEAKDNKKEHGAREFVEYINPDLNSPESPLKGFSEESIKSSILGKRRLVQSVLEITEDFVLNKRPKDSDNVDLGTSTEGASVPSENDEPVPVNSSVAVDLESERAEIKATNSQDDSLMLGESDPKAVSHINELSPRCVTPSGDTLSLGSTIDFDNGEFIVLSEISSDENFSQDEEHGNRTRAKLKSQKLAEKQKSSSKIDTEKKDGDGGEASASEEKTNNTKTQKGRKHAKSKRTQSKERGGNKIHETTPLVPQDKNHDESTELEANLSRDDKEADNADPETKTPAECRADSIEKAEETQEIDKPVENEAPSEVPSTKLPSKKSSVTKDDSGKKKNSESKKPPKSDDLKREKSPPKDVSTRENDVRTNLHRIKHRHRMKHKKNKKSRISPKQVKDAVKDGELVTVVKKQETKEEVIARMFEIDLEIQKLISEKMKLHQMIQSGELPTEEIHAPAKEESKPQIETQNNSSRETDHHILNVEANAPLAKQKSSGSSSQQKSSKIVAAVSDETSQKDSSVKKSKKPHKHERTSKQDNIAVQSEPKKSITEKPVDSKGTTLRTKHTTEEKSSSNKKESHSRSSSNGNKRKEEEAHSSRKEEHGKNNPAKETAEGNPPKSKKSETQTSPKKKASKIPDPKEELLRWMKREEQLFGASGDANETRATATPEKQQVPQIYSDESSQVSLAQDHKEPKKAPTKGLALLEETYKRERALSRKRRAVLCKRKKERLKSLQKSLSPAEEEMPLDLLYSKKFQKKKEPTNNAKIKRTTSDEVLEHILEAINAVAENRIDEYHSSDKAKAERHSKVGSKAKLADNLTNCTTEQDFGVLWPFEDVQSSKNLGENLSEDDFRELDEFGEARNVLRPGSASSIHESDNRFPIDKIIEISRENNGPDITRNSVDQVSLFDNIYGGELDDELEPESGQMTCRFSPASNAFGYLNDIGQFDDSNSTFIPHDQMSHSNSISRNLDIEKGLDVLDSMLETVGSDLEGISPEEVHSGFVKRDKRKRMFSGESDVSKKRSAMSKAEMMSCSVRLVDCKYTYLKNCWNAGAAQRFTILPTESPSNDPPNATSLKAQSSTESHPRTPKSKSPVLPQVLSEEPTDWSLKDHPLIDCDENLPTLNSEPYLSPDADLGLNHIDGSFPYDDDDLEIMKLHPSCDGEVEEEPESWETLGKIQDGDLGVTESPAHTIVALDVNHDPKISLTEEISMAEITPLSNSPSKLVETKTNREESMLGSENSVVAEEAVAAECRDDVEVLNQPKDPETNEVEEVEPPRIQYSVHKGPILDVKVFGDSILAASEDGVIYRYSQTCNGILNTYEGHVSAVTCIHVLQAPASSRDWLFSSSLDGSLRCFDIMTSHQVRGAADVGSPVQCMDQSWGVIFLGTKSGYVFRFHIKSHAFKGDEIKFSDESVLALKATTEGPRRVLIVASRSQPITIRDAQTGLFLRTVSGHKSHTVYSLMMDSNLVYCGTSSTAIPVFDFINGTQVKLYNAGPGIVCMRMYKWLLFAGCYDGNIYVFDTKEQRLVCSTPGPGNMLLSMDIVENKIVAGSKDRRLHMWQMPDQVLTLLAGRT